MTRLYQTNVFSTDDACAPVVIRYPAPLSRAEFDELKDFVAIWLRGLERVIPTAILAGENTP